MLFERIKRRGFLAGLGTLAAGAVAADPVGAQQPKVHEADRWVLGVKGSHRQLFDFNAHGGGLPLIHMHNFIETLKSVYQVPGSDISVVGTFYGGTVPLAWNDAMWAKYNAGAALGIEDPATKHPLVRNWFNRPAEGDPVFMNGYFRDANIASLHSRWATFLLCNNALRVWVSRLAGSGGNAAAIDAELRANLLPGVVVVPAMVVAFEVAHRHGLTYSRT